jgi:hypothetical protein
MIRIPARYHLHLVTDPETTEPMRPARSRNETRGEVEKAARAGRGVHFKLRADESCPDILRAGFEHNRSNRQAVGQRSRPFHLLDERFLHRLAVNFLRHARTDYDNVLVFRRTGSNGPAAAYNREVKLQVLDAIAARYPELEAECARQGRRLVVPLKAAGEDFLANAA